MMQDDVNVRQYEQRARGIIVKFSTVEQYSTAVRGSEEERGCGVGGGERKGVGVALTCYRDRDLSVGRLFGSLFCLAVLNPNFA